MNKNQSDKNAEIEAAEAATLEQEKKIAAQKQAKPEWLKQGGSEVKVDNIIKEKLLDHLKKNNIKYEETKQGLKVTIEGNKQIHFDFENNKIHLPDLSENSLNKAAELTAKSGGTVWDLSILSKQLEKDPNKESILKTAYNAGKKEGLEVRGLNDDLAKKFESEFTADKVVSPQK